MDQQDLTANTISISGIIMTLAEFQTLLTVTVLCTALVLNVVRIIEIRKRSKSDQKEKDQE
jgi:hypothetical protein